MPELYWWRSPSENQITGGLVSWRVRRDLRNRVDAFTGGSTWYTGCTAKLIAHSQCVKMNAVAVKDETENKILVEKFLLAIGVPAHDYSDFDWTPEKEGNHNISVGYVQDVTCQPWQNTFSVNVKKLPTVLRKDYIDYVASPSEIVDKLTGMINSLRTVGGQLKGRLSVFADGFLDDVGKVRPGFVPISGSDVVDGILPSYKGEKVTLQKSKIVLGQGNFVWEDVKDANGNVITATCDDAGDFVFPTGYDLGDEGEYNLRASYAGGKYWEPATNDLYYFLPMTFNFFKKIRTRIIPKFNNFIQGAGENFIMKQHSTITVAGRAQALKVNMTDPSGVLANTEVEFWSKDYRNNKNVKLIPKEGTIITDANGEFTASFNSDDLYHNINYDNQTKAWAIQTYTITARTKENDTYKPLDATIAVGLQAVAMRLSFARTLGDTRFNIDGSYYFRCAGEEFTIKLKLEQIEPGLGLDQPLATPISGEYVQLNMSGAIGLSFQQQKTGYDGIATFKFTPIRAGIVSFTGTYQGNSSQNYPPCKTLLDSPLMLIKKYTMFGDYRKLNIALNQTSEIIGKKQTELSVVLKTTCALDPSLQDLTQFTAMTPLEDALVKLTNLQGEQIATAYTDVNGKATFNFVPEKIASAYIFVFDGDAVYRNCRGVNLTVIKPKTRITFFADGKNGRSVPVGQGITLSGILSYDPDGQWLPLANQSVSIQNGATTSTGLFNPLNIVTDSQGAFSTKFTPSKQGLVYLLGAKYAGDDDYESSESSMVNLTILGNNWFNPDRCKNIKCPANKPFQCPICCECFATEDELNEHTRRETGGETGCAKLLPWQGVGSVVRAVRCRIQNRPKLLQNLNLGGRTG